MIFSIAAVAVVTHLVFALDPPLCLLLGAVLAPTDPVLASSVAVSDSSDHDRLRYGLSGEAGLNDGMAFPFVVFALSWHSHGEIAGWSLTWALERLLWGVPTALALGHWLGQGVGRVAIWLRARDPHSNAPNDLLLLALIFLSYVLAEQIGTWGFLAVFAAGVGLRRAEVRVVRKNPHPDHVPAEGSGGDSSHPPAEHLVLPKASLDGLDQPAVAAGVLMAESLSFGETLERLIEFVLVLWIGVALSQHWEPGVFWIAAALLLLIRPVGAVVLLIGTPTSRAQRWLMGWFGVRGIGSLYYLSYALTHGLEARAASVAISATLWVTAASIVLHGISGAPLLGRYQRGLERDAARAAARSAQGSTA
jgi:NhaP-type Na+/H+ or K+/H+ antiporter